MDVQKSTLIWLNGIGLHSDIIQRIISFLGDVSEIHEIDIMELESAGILTKATAAKIRKSDYKSDLDKLMHRMESQNIKALSYLDENYPDELLNIPDRPVVLYWKGEIAVEGSLAIGIVGSRKATAYGRWATEHFVKELSRMGVTIVSGMAVGIDSIAHKTALENQGRTIGVLGNGIDHVYPKSNRWLYNEACINGALISEFPPGTQPLPHHFPMRNRIISGLSLAVIVMEAQKRSGSLITAHHALSQGKEVFALPGNINSLYSQGTNMLIRDGARPLLDMDDILEEVKELQLLENQNRNSRICEMDLSETEMKVLNCLKEGPIHSDVITIKTSYDIQTVISTLTILELKGIIKEISSRIFTLV